MSNAGDTYGYLVWLGTRGEAGSYPHAVLNMGKYLAGLVGDGLRWPQMQGLRAALFAGGAHVRMLIPPC